MRIRLPLHVWAEQLETVMANRMYKPKCPEFKMEQFKLWRKLIDEYEYLQEDIALKTGTEPCVRQQMRTAPLERPQEPFGQGRV